MFVTACPRSAQKPRLVDHHLVPNRAPGTNPDFAPAPPPPMPAAAVPDVGRLGFYLAPKVEEEEMQD